MLTIMKFPSSPYEKLQNRKICKFGEKATVPKVPLPRVGKSLIHRTALFTSLIIILSYPVLFINRVHIACFITHWLLWHYIRKLTEAFFFVEHGPRTFTVLQQKSCKNINSRRSFHPLDHLENKWECCSNPLQRQQMYLSASALPESVRKNWL